MRHSPAFPAAVILVLTGLEIVMIGASLLGWNPLDLTRVDYATAALAIPLGLVAGVGLLWRRRWGWMAAVGGVAAGLLVEIARLPFAADSWSIRVVGLGIVLLVDGAILALLNAPAVRAALAPPPPDTGVLGDLPVEPCCSVGLAMVVGGLTLEVGGWMILALWVAVVAVRRLRRRVGSTI